MPVDSYTYIGRKVCGCIVAASVDGTSHTANDVRDFIRDGLAIERLRTEYVRTLIFGCVHEKATRKDQGELL